MVAEMETRRIVRNEVGRPARRAEINNGVVAFSLTLGHKERQ
jgi:hypothetical protein